MGYGSVLTMPPRRPVKTTTAARRRRARERHLRRVAVSLLLAAMLLVTLVLTAFASAPAPTRTLVTAPAKRLLPAGPPRPQVVATVAALRLQLPVPQSRVTAVGFHRAGSGALPLRPVGTRANRGFLSRVFHRIVGDGGGGMRWYQLGGDGRGAPTSMLDVGAAPGTDVSSPVDGTVVAITDYVLDGRRYGARVDVQPADAPSLVVSLTRLQLDPAVSVGYALQAGTSKVGAVLDLSKVEQQQLARYTQDAGNHVSLEVRAGAAVP